MLQRRRSRTGTAGVCLFLVFLLHLKPVNLELIWLCKSRLGQPLTNVFSLISLQLQNLSVLWMLDHCSVASELLLASTDDFFQVILGRQPLDRGESFPSVSLLDPYVDKAILNAFLRALDCISKRVESV